MIDSLIVDGADETNAKRFATKVTISVKLEILFEVYGRGSIVEETSRKRKDHIVKGLHAMDLRTNKPDVTLWNSMMKSHRHKAQRLQTQLKPTWLMGSPLCTPLSIWNVSINYKKWTRQRWLRCLLKEGCTSASALSFANVSTQTQSSFSSRTPNVSTELARTRTRKTRKVLSRICCHS